MRHNCDLSVIIVFWGHFYPLIRFQEKASEFVQVAKSV